MDITLLEVEVELLRVFLQLALLALPYHFRTLLVPPVVPLQDTLLPVHRVPGVHAETVARTLVVLEHEGTRLPHLLLLFRHF